MSSHFWTRRQVPSDVEENDPSAFLAAHLGNPRKVTNSVNSHQICGAGSICNSITIAGEGNAVHGPLPQGLGELPYAVADQQNRRYSSPVTPVQSGTVSDLSQPIATKEVRRGKHYKWSHIEDIFHLTRRMALRGDFSGSPHSPLRRRQMEGGQIEGGIGSIRLGSLSAAQASARAPPNHATNNQRCGNGGVCNSVLIANGDSNIVHPPPLRNTEGSPQQAGGQSSQSNISSLQGGSPILPAQTVFQPTREMYPPSPAGSPFIPFTPVPGVPGSDRASIKKEYRGSRSSETFALPRRQISPRSRSQEPSNPMADANSPPSENLLPSSSVTILPTPTTSRGRFGLDYDGYSLIQLAARDTRFGPMAQFGTATTTPIPTGGIRTGEMVAWPAV